MVFLGLSFLPSSPTKADAPIIEHTISDDGWVEVPLDFTFPFYGNSYVTSFMFSNGVVGFLDPLNVAGSGYIYDGLCCNGQNFEGGATGVRFNYTIMPFHTDLIDTGIGKFYTQGDSTYQKYMWENLAEYYNRDTSNTFDLTIFPLGNIEINYEQVQINNHAVTVAVVGDLSAGEYEQWFYNHQTQDGALFWNSSEDDPVVIGSGESICSVVPDSHLSCLYYPETYADAYYEQQCNLNPLYNSGCVGYSDAYFNQQCTLDSLYSNACPDFETAFLDQQCEFNPTYSMYCDGYEEAIQEEEIQLEEEELEEIYVLSPPETYIEIEIPLTDFQAMVEIFEAEFEEIDFQEVTQEDIIAEIEAEIEEFFEPIPDEEPEPIEELEAIEEEVDEPEPEEDTSQEEQAEEESEQEEVVEDESTEDEPAEEVAEEPEETEQEDRPSDTGDSEQERKTAKRDKMKEIITNKLNNLAKEMGVAVSLEAQKDLQNYILALLNYNAGFNSYNKALQDSLFYRDRDIYENKTIPENQNGLRNGLANEILHNKLVDLQWQR